MCAHGIKKRKEKKKEEEERRRRKGSFLDFVDWRLRSQYCKMIHKLLNPALKMTDDLFELLKESFLNDNNFRDESN